MVTAVPAREAFEGALGDYLRTPSGTRAARIAVWYLAGSSPRALLSVLCVLDSVADPGEGVPAALLEDLRSTLVEDARRGLG